MERQSAGVRSKLALVAVMLLGSCGCVAMDSFVLDAAMPPGPHAAAQVIAMWCNQVATTPDPAHNGEPVRGLAGRVYLFGPNIDCPVTGDGSLVVDLYVEAVDHAPPAQSSAPLEEWRFDRDTLHRLLRRDAVGWGYTLFLPWSTYRPDITHVYLKVRYDPRTGGPLYAASARITLNRDAGQPGASADPAARIEIGKRTTPPTTPVTVAPAAAVAR
jgi:hypothetical protein